MSVYNPAAFLSKFSFSLYAILSVYSANFSHYHYLFLLSCVISLILTPFLGAFVLASLFPLSFCVRLHRIFISYISMCMQCSFCLPSFHFPVCVHSLPHSFILFSARFHTGDTDHQFVSLSFLQMQLTVLVFVLSICSISSILFRPSCVVDPD